MIHSTKTAEEVLADFKAGMISNDEVIEFFDQLIQLYNNIGKCSLTGYSHSNLKNDFLEYLDDISYIVDDLRDIESKLSNFEFHVRRQIKGL